MKSVPGPQIDCSGTINFTQGSLELTVPGHLIRSYKFGRRDWTISLKGVEHEGEGGKRRGGKRKWKKEGRRVVEA